MRIVVAHSDDPDPTFARRDIVAQVRRGLGSEEPVAALVFAAMQEGVEALLEGLRSSFPGTAMIGCSTDGELSDRIGFREDSLTMVAFAGPGLSARTALGRGVSEDPDGVTATAARALVSEGQVPRVVFTLPDGLARCGADAIVEGLTRELGVGVPLVGGTAGDQWNFKSTWQFADDQVVSDGVPLLALYGPVKVGVGVSSGWTPIGQRGLVTQAVGPTIVSIDHAPAYQFYERYLGPDAETTPEYPLGVFLPGSTVPILRAPLRTDPESGAITFTGNVPQGAEVQITEAVREDMLEACGRSARAALAGLDGLPPRGALIFSCAARKQLLGTRTAAELSSLCEVLPDAIPIGGFYTYGEVAAPSPDSAPCFHNETIVTVLLAEDDRG